VGALITFDVDWRRTGAYLESSDSILAAVVGRVGSCIGCSGVDVRHSASGNGYHVKVDCDHTDCYLCRLVFDSPVRLDADLGRPVWSREVLWDLKTFLKGGGWVVGEAGPWRCVE